MTGALPAFQDRFPRPESEFLAFLAAGQFMIQRSRSSERYVFYPRIAEPVTGAADLEWVPASGRGTVYSVTVIRQKPPAKDYGLVLVDLDEGVRMMSRVEGIPSTMVKIGMRVHARISSEDGSPIVVFDPV